MVTRTAAAARSRPPIRRAPSSGWSNTVRAWLRVITAPNRSTTPSSCPARSTWTWTAPRCISRPATCWCNAERSTTGTTAAPSPAWWPSCWWRRSRSNVAPSSLRRRTRSPALGDQFLDSLHLIDGRLGHAVDQVQHLLGTDRADVDADLFGLRQIGGVLLGCHE